MFDKISKPVKLAGGAVLGLAAAGVVYFALAGGDSSPDLAIAADPLVGSTPQNGGTTLLSGDTASPADSTPAPGLTPPAPPAPVPESPVLGTAPVPPVTQAAAPELAPPVVTAPAGEVGTSPSAPPTVPAGENQATGSESSPDSHPQVAMKSVTPSGLEKKIDRAKATQDLENLELLMNLEAKRLEYLKNMRERLAVEQKINRGKYDDSAELTPALPVQLNALPQTLPPMTLPQVPQILPPALEPQKNVEQPKPATVDPKLVVTAKSESIVLKGIDGVGEATVVTLLVDNARRSFVVGDTVKGWKIDEVHSDFVKLTKGRDTKFLEYSTSATPSLMKPQDAKAVGGHTE